MKSIFFLTTFMIIFSACSHKNAFSNFEMTQEQELSASSLQNSKVKNREGVDGIFSAIYLNEVYPKQFHENENFYIFYYLKENQENSTQNSLDGINISVKMNGSLPIEVKKLERENPFSNLIEIQNRWTQYYLVSFASKENNISLVFESGQSSSDPLSYQKDEQ